MGTQSALDGMRQASSLLDAIRRADDVTVAASRDGGPRVVRLLAQVAADPADQLAAIAAVHSLAQVFDQSADEVLVSLLTHDAPFLREHAAWAFGVRLPRLDAVSPLVAMVADGGFPGMLAQRTLEQWSASAPEQVALALEGALLGIVDPGARARLVETIGLVPGRIPQRLLRRVAVDPTESDGARAAAIAGLGDLTPSDAIVRIVTDLADGDGELAEVARLALFDLTASVTGPGQSGLRGPGSRGPGRQGLTIAQLFLHADIDRELSQVGAGDNGGIATLLVRLGDALVAGGAAAGAIASDDQRLVERVLTISRGRPDGALRCLPDVASAHRGHAFATVPFRGDPVPADRAWPLRIAAQRGIRRILRVAGSVDAIHLRMADVGSLAAATVARERDIPIVFTLAPDPHAVIDALDTSGALTRANFGIVDAREHFWFRTRLAQRIAADAAHLVLFPRPELARDLRALVGIDIVARPERHAVIAEGIDVDVIERSRRAALAAGACDDLDALLRTLPTSRQGLPLALTVGRLHRVKGMATLVAAWAGDVGLRERCNLLVVGGDLESPSSDEREQLALIDAVVPRAGAASRGLLLAGHRANGTVASWLAAARFGRPGLAAPHGVYVCASLKEEFGIAILEAMATGLAVVAPAAGGPATYVRDGVTGFLVDTRDAAALARGVDDALDLASGPFGADGAELARQMVLRRFTIGAMAQNLADVYREVVSATPMSWAMSAS